MFTFLAELLGRLLFFILGVSGAGSFPKPLTAREEAECLRRMAEGDEAARSTLIEHNLRLVAHVIKKHYAACRDQEDLLSIGTIGLIKAVDTFSPSRGTRIATYAARCIENEILMHLRSRKKSAQDVYMSDPIDTDSEGNALTLADILAAEEDVFEGVEQKLRAEHLYRHLPLLEPRQQQILCLRYGLQGRAPLTQREVAAQLGISRSYVSRIEKKALETLRQAMK